VLARLTGSPEFRQRNPGSRRNVSSCFRGQDGRSLDLSPPAGYSTAKEDQCRSLHRCPVRFVPDSCRSAGVFTGLPVMSAVTMPVHPLLGAQKLECASDRRIWFYLWRVPERGTGTTPPCVSARPVCHVHGVAGRRVGDLPPQDVVLPHRVASKDLFLFAERRPVGRHGANASIIPNSRPQMRPRRRRVTDAAEWWGKDAGVGDKRRGGRRSSRPLLPDETRRGWKETSDRRRKPGPHSDRTVASLGRLACSDSLPAFTATRLLPPSPSATSISLPSVERPGSDSTNRADDGRSFMPA